MLENTEEAIKNGQSRETDNIYMVHKVKTNTTKHKTICVRHHHTQNTRRR